MRSGGGSFARLGLHIGEDWWTHLSTYPDHPPILDVDTGTLSVSVNFASTRLSQAAVEFARELANNAARFAAEVERVYAWQTGTSNGNGGPAGNGEAA